MPFRRLSRESIASGAFLSFDRLEIEGPDGQRVERFMLAHPGAVAFLPVDGEDVLLVRQYRAPLDLILLEVPAGRLEPGERDRRDAVRRECIEEVGMDPGVMESLGHMFTSGGISDERIDLFWVTDLTQVNTEPDGVEEAYAEIVRHPIKDLARLIGSGDLTDGKSVATIARYLMRDRA